MRKDVADGRTPLLDSTIETFAYDKTHLAMWQMPKDVAKGLPQALITAIEDWSCAGAAVCTSLARIRKLDNDSIYRGWPSKPAYQHLSRHSSVRSTTVTSDTKTPPVSSPEYGPPAAPTAAVLDKIEPIRHRSIPGVESPPYTPIDSQTCNTPALPAPEGPIAIPDMQQLARRLTSTSRRDSVTAGSAFDENAWETYLSQFRAELHDMTTGVWPRFVGCGRTIDRIRVAVAGDFRQFDAWWIHMRAEVAHTKQRVELLELPELKHVRLERESKGLLV